MRPDGPNLDSSMLWTFMVGMLAYTFLFFSLFLARYAVERYERELILREATPAAAHGVDS